MHSRTYSMTLPSTTCLLCMCILSYPLDWRWGRMCYDKISSLPQAATMSCLKLWAPWTCSSTCTWQCYQCLICRCIRLSTQFLPFLLQVSWLPHRSNPRYSQLLHHLYGTPHQACFCRLLPLGHLQWARTVSSWCPKELLSPPCHQNALRLQEALCRSHHLQMPPLMHWTSWALHSVHVVEQP